MSGVAIVCRLLLDNTDLTNVVSSDNIAGGMLPQKTALPAISIKTIDALRRVPVDASGTKRMVTERVQVTVLAKSYAEKKQILNLVRKALPISRGTVGGIKCDSVLPDVEGPDLDDVDDAIYEQSRDYMVIWHEE